MFESRHSTGAQRGTAVFSAIMVLVGAQAAFSSECRKPPAPTIPDGAAATRDEMLKGQAALRAFQDANMQYMHCLEETFAAAEAAVKDSSDPEEKARSEAAYAEAAAAYTAAVSADEALAGSFNVELRKFRERRR